MWGQITDFTNIRRDLLIIRPITVFLIYLGIIVLFALLYYFVPGVVEVTKSSFLKSIYFSVVTITTLGYGEITPKSDLGMALTSLEAIIGIVIIGLFLNSLWHDFSSRIEKSQEKSVNKRIAEQNLRKLISYYQFLNMVIIDYKIALSELTTPWEERNGNLELDPYFKFSNLRDMYRHSSLLKNDTTKSVIHLYFEKLDALTSELKFILSNFDLIDYQELHKHIIEFLTISKAQDVREALYSYETTGFGDKLKKDHLVEMIKMHEICPKLEDYRSNLITPVIHLCHALQFQITRINIIIDKFENLMPKKN